MPSDSKCHPKQCLQQKSFCLLSWSVQTRAGNERSVSTTPLGVRHESKTVLARQKHREHVSTQQKFTHFHTDFLIMNKTAPRLTFRVFQVHKMSVFSISFMSFKSHVSCLESQPYFGFCLLFGLVFLLLLLVFFFFLDFFVCFFKKKQIFTGVLIMGVKHM